LIIQDKDKYNTPKYRLVVRITNSKVIAQIVYATIKGDMILTAADSTEFKKWGLKTGLANYASAYATGLLVARRLLKQLDMEKFYKGNDKIDATVYDVNEKQNEERRPFKAILDTGLVRTTTGARVFGALKGAADGGIWVPHNEKRFPGYKKAEGEEGEADKYEAKVHRDRIFGVHIDKYMKELSGDKEAFKKQFRVWEETLKSSGAKSIEDLFTKIHAEIRKNPTKVKKEAKKAPKRDFAKKRQIRLTNDQRKKNVEKKF
jgi:large subunit ribosomal protein L5e